MAKEVKTSFLGELTRRYGGVRKLERSQSLYEIGGGAARVYIRYSKLHSRRETFYGLRRKDLRQLEGYPSLLCFLWEGQNEPLLVPFSEFEDVFRSMEPAPDGQYKIHLIAPSLRPKFSIVANDARRVLFVRQVNRPTFRTSGLSELCTFFEYANVVGWYSRIRP